MPAEQIVFLLCAALILVSAVMVVTVRNLVHAALWLVAALFGVAVLYAVLSANFLAVVQIVVYIGAIAILFLFAVMLTRRDLVVRTPGMRGSWWIAAVLALLVLGGLVFLIVNQPGVNRTALAIPAGVDTLHALGNALVSSGQYLLPFEVSSILLLAALVGAVYLAVSRKS